MRLQTIRRSGLSYSAVLTARCLLAGSSLLVMSSVALAQEQVPQDEPAEGKAIVVTGLRASLANSAAVKENSDQIKDVISAEDIGKLPDTNVAEAMQRITGVQINRDQGEGSEISVRGFSQNRIEINGQSQLGSSSQGGVAFNTIPSAAFKSVEVIKTPSADEIEGALGGIVRFNTRQPLDNNGKLVLAATAKAQYAQRAKAWTPNVNVLASKGWELGDGSRFGALLSYTRNQRRLRQDFFDVRGWEAVNGVGRDLDGDGIVGESIQRNADGIITNLQDGLYVPMQTRIRVTEQDRKLDSWTGALQFRTVGGTEFYVNGTLNQSRSSDNQYQVIANFSSIITPDTASPGNSKLGTQYANKNSMVISPDHTLLSAFVGSTDSKLRPTGVPFNLSGASNPPQDRIWTAQAGAKFQPSDRFRFEVQVSGGKGRKYTQYINTTSGIGTTDRPFMFFDFGADADIPTIVPLQTALNGVPVAAYDPAARYDFNRISIYNLANITVNRDTENNSELAVRTDFDWEFNTDWLSSIEFGSRLSTVSISRSRMRARDTQIATDGTLGGSLYSALAANEPGIVILQPNQQVLAGATGDFPQTFWIPDPKYLVTNLDRLSQKYGFGFNPDPSFGFNAKRTDVAAYLKANFKFSLGNLPIRGNVGVRYVNTQQRSSGAVPTGTQATYAIVTQTGSTGYSRVLPSASFIIQPGDRFLVRLGAGKAMSRPELFRASPTLVISDSFDRATQGNPFLLPEEVWQYDLSIEKYYGKSNYVSLALFYKDFKQRVENGIVAQCLPTPPTGLETTPGNDGCLVGQDLTRVEKPLNVGGAKVKGLEVAWQQSLDFLPSPLDGLGFIANYTFVDAGGGGRSATGAILPVQDLSRHSYNLIGYYEKYGITARVAYNWRSSFYDERTDTNQASFAKPYGQLDASLGYDITPRISVTAEALNVLNAPEERYQEISERILSYRVNDRRFLVGVRVKY